MIKARATDKDGYPVYFLGISRGNMEYLTAGRPMVVNLRELGGRGTVIIFTGETEESMRDEFTKVFDVQHTTDWKTPNQ